MKMLFFGLTLIIIISNIITEVVSGKVTDEVKNKKSQTSPVFREEEAPFHQCIHDSAMIQDRIREALQSSNYVIEVKGNASVQRQFDKQDRQNIRIVPSYEDLYVSGHYCSRIGENVESYEPGKIQCSTQDDILTQEKRDLLIKKVIPAALNLLQKALKVDPSNKLIVPKGDCSPFTVPSSHTTTGVPNADYVLYVASAPTEENTVAFAGACGFNKQRKPVLGLTNIGTKFLKWDEKDPLKNHNLVRTAAHEILHALGFSSSLFGKKKLTATERRRGKTVTYFKSPTAVQKAREYFGCNTLNGPEIEDQGGQGTGGSHVERRNHFDDIMAGVTNNMMFLSTITLAVMQDLGYYEIDWNKAETANWMRNIGCGAGSSLCNTAEGGKDKYFCFEKDADGCTFDRTSVGSCKIGRFASGEIPSYFQYFTDETEGGRISLLDYCPAYLNNYNALCTDPNGYFLNSHGCVYGPTSRCYDAKNLHKANQVYTAPFEQRCLETLCNFSSNTINENNGGLYFRPKDVKQWIHCAKKGDVIDMGKYGYIGTVTCPDPSEVCTLNLYNKDIPLPEPSTPAAAFTTTSSKAQDASTASTTTSPTKYFNIPIATSYSHVILILPLLILILLM